MQGAQRLRNEAYLSYVAMTKDEAQRRRWTFYEVVKSLYFQFGNIVHRLPDVFTPATGTSARFGKTLSLIKDAGYKTIEVDVSEFRKLDGGLSCLSLRF